MTISKVKSHLFFIRFFLTLSSFKAQAHSSSLAENPAQIVDYHFSNARQLTQALMDGPEKVSSLFSIRLSNDNHQYDERSNAYLRDGDYYYLIKKETQGLKTDFIVFAPDNNYAQAYMSAENLAQNAAEALNSNPNQFQGTNMEAYYSFAQDQGERI